MLKWLNTKIRKNPRWGRVALGLIPDWRWHVSVADLGRFEIRLRRNRMYWLRHPLIGEGFMLGAVERMVRPGQVIFDLGANIGLYTRFFLQRYGASKVYSFEPMSENRPQLKRNLALGQCDDKAEIVPVAVGDQDGMVSFQLDDLTSNSGTLENVTDGKASQSRSQYGLPPLAEQVRVVRLDTLVGDGTLPVPEFIKIDVEGAEAMVLMGARNLLKTHHPDLLLEMHGWKAAVATLDVLWDLDYHCFAYLKSGDTRVYKEIVRADRPLVNDKYSVHFIAASADAKLLAEPILDPAWLLN